MLTIDTNPRSFLGGSDVLQTGHGSPGPAQSSCGHSRLGCCSQTQARSRQRRHTIATSRSPERPRPNSRSLALDHPRTPRGTLNRPVRSPSLSRRADDRHVELSVRTHTIADGTGRVWCDVAHAITLFNTSPIDPRRAVRAQSLESPAGSAPYDGRDDSRGTTRLDRSDARSQMVRRQIDREFQASTGRLRARAASARNWSHARSTRGARMASRYFSTKCRAVVFVRMRLKGNCRSRFRRCLDRDFQTFQRLLLKPSLTK
jgi:hypothetical protein